MLVRLLFVPQSSARTNQSDASILRAASRATKLDELVASRVRKPDPRWIEDRQKSRKWRGHARNTRGKKIFGLNSHESFREE